MHPICLLPLLRSDAVFAEFVSPAGEPSGF
jgi:hypothetical protein